MKMMANNMNHGSFFAKLYATAITSTILMMFMILGSRFMPNIEKMKMMRFLNPSARSLRA